MIEADLPSVFQLLAANGLVINTQSQKCLFGQSTITFLGHKITPNGITSLPEKVKAIEELPKPDNKKDLKRLLGMINFYHTLLTGIAKCLSTDASDLVFGAELSQKHHGIWRPIAFFSRKLSLTQSRYSSFDRELLAIYSAIQQFRYFLEGRPFSVLTDHKPLTHALTSKTARSPRQERQLSHIAQFTTDIQYISTTDNVVADVLSRASSGIEEPTIASASHIPSLDLAEMAAEKCRDPKVAELRKNPGSLNLEEVDIGGCIVLCDVYTARPRPIVPTRWTIIVFETVHNLSHPDHKPTTRAISARYVWPGLKREVKNMVRACHSCQASKIGRHTKTALKEF